MLDGGSGKQKRMMGSGDPAVMDALFKWFVEAHGWNGPVLLWGVQS